MINYAATTDIGVCKKNDDRIALSGKVFFEGFASGKEETHIIAVVCDGVGGYAYGDEAAEITAQIFADISLEVLTQADIEQAVVSANEMVLQKQKMDNEHKDMATTLAGIHLSGSNFIAFNVGDSKVFRYRNPYLSQLSVDHTALQEAIALGLTSVTSTNAKKGGITRCIGDIALCEPAIIVGDNKVFEDDVFLLCSDGLSDVVSIDDIEGVLSEPVELHEKCDRLLCLAKQNNSLDNISIILLEVASL